MAYFLQGWRCPDRAAFRVLVDCAPQQVQTKTGTLRIGALQDRHARSLALRTVLIAGIEVDWTKSGVNHAPRYHRDLGRVGLRNGG